MTKWNLKPLYDSPEDPRIETDMKQIEQAALDFAGKYDIPEKDYLSDSSKLSRVLADYEKLMVLFDGKPLLYFLYVRCLDSSNNQVAAKIALFSERLTKSVNAVKFLELSLGKIAKQKQKEFLADSKLGHFKYFLKCIFDDAKHHLSLQEEKIVALKSLPSHEMWVSQNDKLLNAKMVKWRGKEIAVNEALNLVSEQKTAHDRKKLSGVLTTALKNVSEFSEGEINAIYTNKKIDDELRGFSKPYEETVLQYRNDLEVVETLRKVVADNFAVSHKFYAIKAKLLKQKKLSYSDRSAKIGIVAKKFPFDKSVSLLKEIFGRVDGKYEKFLDSYVKNGEVDAFPKKGKKGGAFCSATFTTPVYILLNHVDSLRSFETLAHELGHAFHSELSRGEGALYSSYSLSLAETASTLFEAISSEALLEQMTKKEKVIALHDKINGDIATVFRQIACFNFELDLHTAVRTKGFVPKEEIAQLHNKNMKAYLGPKFELDHDDGYMFVQWSHIRRFFYVYSYAYGLLVSKALLRRYRSDPSFWQSIEKFLSAGGKDSPENILKEIGIDVRSPEFFLEGIREIEDDVKKLEELVR